MLGENACDAVMLSQSDLAGRESFWLRRKLQKLQSLTAIQLRWGQEGSKESFQSRNPWAKPWGPQEPAQVQSRDQRKEGQDIGSMKGKTYSQRITISCVWGCGGGGDSSRGEGLELVRQVEQWGN